MKNLLTAVILLCLLLPFETQAVHTVKVKPHEDLRNRQIENIFTSENDIRQPARKITLTQKRIIKKLKKIIEKPRRKGRRDNTYGGRSLRWAGWGVLFLGWIVGFAFIIVSLVLAIKGLKQDKDVRKAIGGFAISTAVIVAALSLFTVANSL